jgi:hypothetical protein
MFFRRRCEQCGALLRKIKEEEEGTLLCSCPNESCGEFKKVIEFRTFHQVEYKHVFAC